MMAQVLLFDIFFEKDPHLNAFDYILGFIFYAVSRTKTDLRNKYMI